MPAGREPPYPFPFARDGWTPGGREKSSRSKLRFIRPVGGASLASASKRLSCRVCSACSPASSRRGCAGGAGLNQAATSNDTSKTTATPITRRCNRTIQGATTATARCQLVDCDFFRIELVHTYEETVLVNLAHVQCPAENQRHVHLHGNALAQGFDANPLVGRRHHPVAADHGIADDEKLCCQTALHLERKHEPAHPHMLPIELLQGGGNAFERAGLGRGSRGRRIQAIGSQLPEANIPIAVRLTLERLVRRRRRDLCG